MDRQRDGRESERTKRICTRLTNELANKVKKLYMNEKNSEWTDGQTRVIGIQFVNEFINYTTNFSMIVQVFEHRAYVKMVQVEKEETVFYAAIKWLQARLHAQHNSLLHTTCFVHHR